MTDAVNEQADAPTINLQDLNNLLAIIDVSAERGAFRGNELSSVGVTRDKLANFLAAAKQAEEAAAEGVASEETPDVAEKPVEDSRKKTVSA